MRQKVGVLLVNLGTPDSPKRSDVRKYLKEFLTDGRVIDIPYIPRQMLVRGFIAPFRSGSSSKSYKEIWSDETGSPLMYHGLNLTEKVQAHLNSLTATDEGAMPDFDVFLAMRYQSPSIKDTLNEMKIRQFDKIIVFPLFPQYASASTGSVHQRVLEEISQWWEIPNLALINSYHDDPLMIQTYADAGLKYDLSKFDHILFSFHGLPQRHLKKASKDNGCNFCLSKPDCCHSIHEKNKFCYSAQSYATARAIAEKVNIKESDYTVCFQSRLGKDPWCQPYTSEVLDEMAKEGKKNILCFSPAFVADCLETIFEISEEYQEDFEKVGGEKIQLVESLNDQSLWVESIGKMILKNV